MDFNSVFLDIVSNYIYIYRERYFNRRFVGTVYIIGVTYAKITGEKIETQYIKDFQELI